MGKKPPQEINEDTARNVHPVTSGRAPQQPPAPPAPGGK
jgi:hypothetical protein